MQREFVFGQRKAWRPRNPNRLFFGILLDDADAAQTLRCGRQLARKNRLSNRLIDAERLHISLHHVGDFKRIPSWAEFAANQAGDAVSMTSFDAVLPEVTSFRAFPRADGRPPRHPFVCLGVGKGLFELHDSLGQAMRNIGLRAGSKVGFVPHVTLLYDRKEMPVQRIEPIRLTVDRFCLIHSWRGLSRYTTLQSWELQG